MGQGVIPEKASLAKALLDDEKCPKGNKIFLGIKQYYSYEKPQGHNENLTNSTYMYLVDKINAYFQTNHLNLPISASA